jgi:metal-sulfur cluster biosynthetic enzyme
MPTSTSERQHDATHEAVLDVLEHIVDPCSAASGAPTGLVSLGLVRAVRVEGPADAARVGVTLCITEPGCLMGGVFKTTAERELAELPGVASVSVEMDHGHIWDPGEMAPAYRERLARVRAMRVEQMKRRASRRSPGE